MSGGGGEDQDRAGINGKMGDIPEEADERQQRRMSWQKSSSIGGGGIRDLLHVQGLVPKLDDRPSQ